MKCNSATEVFSRVCGYFRPVANWNRGKQEEFKERKTYRADPDTAHADITGKAGGVILLLALVMLTGCSHNSVVYSDGIGLETQLNPQTFTFGVNFRYGKIFTAVVRENTEVYMEGQGAASGETSAEATGGKTSGTVDGKVKMTVGKQITGYYVDAINAGKPEDELNKYLDAKETGASANTSTETADTGIDNVKQE